jgi:hypothetical protein
MFLGVMFESAICWRLRLAFASLASFSCCLFSFVLMVKSSLRGVMCFKESG